MSAAQQLDGQRRAKERVALRGVAQLLRPGQVGLDVRTLDIGVKGLCIVCPVNLLQSVTYTLRLFLPLKPRVSTSYELQVRVSHCGYSSEVDGFRAGLQFVHTSPDLVTAIESLTHTH